MRIILKNLKTGAFLDESGHWTGKSQKALDFETTRKAEEYCLKHRYFGTAIMARFRDPRHDVALSKY